MKNLLQKYMLLIALLVNSITGMAQVISYDKTRDGIRLVATEETVCRSMTDRLVLAVSLVACVDEEKNDTTYSLITHITGSTPLEVSKNAPMLIKLMDDTVIELKAELGDKEMVRDIIVVNNFVTHSYDINPYFAVTPEQLKAIIKTGVKKIRIDVSPEMYDKEFKKDKVGSVLRMKWAALKETLKKKGSTTGDSFRDGF
jgi:hypothetical protein